MPRIFTFFLTLAVYFFLDVALAAETADDKKWDVSNIPGEAKTIKIDTRSGTWMSLDVSPDGKTIAFDLLGDIYLLPMSGGKAKAINSGLAWSKTCAAIKAKNRAVKLVERIRLRLGEGQRLQITHQGRL